MSKNQHLIRRTTISLAAIAALAAALLSSPAHAHDEPGVGLTPDSHAPAGMMYDHMHKKGEWMFGYNFSTSSTGGDVMNGGNAVSDEALAAAGYMMKPTSMRMNMHMLHLMYAPTDWFNVMLMPMYMDMPMTMKMVPGAGGGHGGGGGGHGGGHGPMLAGGMGGMGGGEMSHSTSGIGDTVAAGLFQLYDDGRHHVHAGLGISIPTGSVSLKNPNGSFVHYGMQLGTGTWDVIPSVTYTGHANRWSWGAQALAQVAMQSRNKSGFRFGNKFEANAWGGYRLTNWLSASARLNYTAQGTIQGAYNGPSHQMSPDDVQSNYGGRVLKAGVGLNAVVGSGPLKGNRVGVEYVKPITQSLNGYQLEQQDALYVNWSMAF
ncbi:transporter [Trinickia mobilis]|uniref:transporter n=1 Tax=Trinickia mobilis TaxID=2816356 RepID=UPI001A906BE7|nr:transporter [Trinickia mobilis]